MRGQDLLLKEGSVHGLGGMGENKRVGERGALLLPSGDGDGDGGGIIVPRASKLAWRLLPQHLPNISAVALSWVSLPSPALPRF